MKMASCGTTAPIPSRIPVSQCLSEKVVDPTDDWTPGGLLCEWAKGLSPEKECKTAKGPAKQKARCTSLVSWSMVS